MCFAGPTSAYPELSVGCADAFNWSERRSPPLPGSYRCHRSASISTSAISCADFVAHFRRRFWPTFQRRLDLRGFGGPDEPVVAPNRRWGLTAPASIGTVGLQHGNCL